MDYSTSLSSVLLWLGLVIQNTHKTSQISFCTSLLTIHLQTSFSWLASFISCASDGREIGACVMHTTSNLQPYLCYERQLNLSWNSATLALFGPEAGRGFRWRHPPSLYRNDKGGLIQTVAFGSSARKSRLHLYNMTDDACVMGAHLIKTLHFSVSNNWYSCFVFMFW